MYGAVRVVPLSIGMAKNADELPVYRRAVEILGAVTPILNRPAVRRDRNLWEQIAEALDSIEANIEEGFEQGSAGRSPGS